MTDYDKLRELAQAATAGPWEVGVPDFDREWVAFTHEYGTSGDPDGTVTTSNGRGKLNVMADAAFIAAANPDVILALLGELRDAKARAWDECALWFDNNALELGSYEVPTAIKANPYREEA